MRELDGTMIPTMNVGDAIVAAITSLKSSGGGTVWIHRLSCVEFRDHETCACDPIGVEVEGEDLN